MEIVEVKQTEQSKQFDERYWKFEILTLATEIETATAAAVGAQLTIKNVLLTADKLADFLFAEEHTPNVS